MNWHRWPANPFVTTDQPHAEISHAADRRPDNVTTHVSEADPDEISQERDSR